MINDVNLNVSCRWNFVEIRFWIDFAGSMLVPISTRVCLWPWTVGEAVP